MSTSETLINEVFAGRVVRKDLVRQVKVGANVPVYVLEYLLGKYCATDDPEAIQAGLRLVNFQLAENFIRPDEANKAMFKVKDQGQGTYIDKVRVRSTEKDDWGEMANFGNRHLHVPESILRQYPRLLEGGIWARVSIEYRGDYDDDNDHPFYITDLQPIQIAGFDLADYISGRQQLTRDQWMNLLIRSIGLEPDQMSQRLKLLTLVRLIPLVERNYNLIELGPRGTGKSFVYRETTPYAILVSGGKTTVANLFYNMSTRKVGLVGLWDVIAFDEIAGIQFDDKTAVQILKDFMESGSFSRGQEEISADASMVFLGNINQPVEILVRSSHLFAPLPNTMRDDMAFIDRLHFYLPGWEVPKLSSKFLTEGYGFIVDYLAEAFRELRKHNFTDHIDAHFSLGTHLNTRDAKAVRKTVAGLIKLLHPHGEINHEEIREYLELALEGRRRIKEQLKKLGSFEYYQTSFSFIEHETMQEHFVGVPEEGGRDLISSDPMPPGSVYTATFTKEDKVVLHRIEVSKISGGSGKLKITGNPDQETKSSLQTAFDFMRSRRQELGIDRELDIYDFHIQAVNLIGSNQSAPVGVAFFIALFSAIKERPVRSALIVLGNLTIQGNIQPLSSLAESLQMSMDNGAKRALIPIENKRSFLEVPGDIVERVDPIFYGDPLTAAMKAMGSD